MTAEVGTDSASAQTRSWLQFQPMPLLKRAAPFDDPEWIFELKMDGFRALAVVEHGRAQLLSRNGHPFASFSELGKHIAASLPNVRAVIDGEICSLDRRGRPQFKSVWEPFGCAGQAPVVARQ